MFCPKCGYKIEGKLKFCPKCGQKLTESKQTGKSKNIVKKAVKGNFSKKKPHKKSSIIAIVSIIAILFVYFVVYVPTTVNAVMKKSNFTSGNGYRVSMNAVKKEIDINVDTHQMGSIESALDNDHFDTSKLAIEEQLAIAANSVDSKTIGKWTIQLRQSTYKDTDAVLWQFSGKDEIHRYQNTAACRKAHQVYLQREADQAQNDQENSDAAGVAGGIAGGVLGWMF